MVILSLMILIIAIALKPYTNNAGNSLIVTESGSSSLNDSGSGISPILLTRITSIVFLFSGALSYNALYIQSIGSGLSIYSGLFQITALSQSFDIVLFLLGSLILLPWSNKFAKYQSDSASPNTESSINKSLISSVSLPRVQGPIVAEYALIALFSALGGSLLLSSGNLLSMYLSIELQSFGVYILATIYRNSESSTNAGLKYFLLGGLSSCLILLGCALIYSYTGVIYFEDIYSLYASSSLNSVTGLEITEINTTIQLGLILIFIGFLFKIAGAPFHNWAPDVYNDVPTIVTTWLTIMPKIAIVILAFEIISTINLDVSSLALSSSTSVSSPLGQVLELNINLIKNLLLISSFLSLIIGTVIGLAQVKIKRLLAYSTVSHVGFMLLALSINTEESLESLLFYLIQYSFTNLNTFFILLSFGYICASALKLNKTNSGSDISLITELRGQFWSNPLLSLSLATSLFSMAGIPPLIGFFAKAQVLYSAIQNGYYFISIIAIIVSVISAYYYLQIIKVMHFDSNPLENKGNTSVQRPWASASMPRDLGSASPHMALNSNSAITNTHSFIISVLTLSLLLFIVKPSILLNSIHLVALTVFYI